MNLIRDYRKPVVALGVATEALRAVRLIGVSKTRAVWSSTQAPLVLLCNRRGDVLMKANTTGNKRMRAVMSAPIQWIGHSSRSRNTQEGR